MISVVEERSTKTVIYLEIWLNLRLCSDLSEILSELSQNIREYLELCGWRDN